MNRGGLAYHSESLFALNILAYAFFKKTSERLCRNGLTKIIFQFPDIFHLGLLIPMDALQRLSNTLLKPRSLDRGIFYHGPTGVNAKGRPWYFYHLARPCCSSSAVVYLPHAGRPSMNGNFRCS